MKKQKLSLKSKAKSSERPTVPDTQSRLGPRPTPAPDILDHYRTLLDSSGGMAYFRSLDGSPYGFNQACRSVTGYSAEDFESNPGLWEDIVHPEDLASARQLFLANPDGFDSHDIEFRLRHESGEQRWLSSRMMGVRDQAGTLAGYLCLDRDITERKLGAQKYYEDFEKFRLFYERSPVSFQSLDAEGRFVEVNPAWLEEMGYRRDEVIGHTFVEFMAPEHHRSFETAFRELMTRGMISGIQFDLERRDGRRLTVELYGRVAYDQDGNFRQTLCEFHDITERAQVTTAVRKLVEGASAKAGEEFFTAMALQLCEILGADHTLIGEVKSLDATTMVTLAAVIDGQPSDVIEYVLAGTPCEQVLARGACSYREGVADEFPGDSRLKEMGVEGYVGSSLVDHNDNPVGAVVALFRHPIENVEFAGSILRIFSSRICSEMERLRAETARRASAEQYRALFESANDGIFVIDGERFVDCNEMTIQMFGTNSRDDILGRTPWEFSPESQPDGEPSRDKARRVVGQALAGKPQRTYWQHKKTDGTLFDAEVSLSRLKVNGKALILAIVRDVTNRRKAQKALQERDAEIRSIVRAAPVGIGVVSDRIFGQVNDRLCEMIGYSVEEMIGQSARMVYESDEEYEWVGDQKYGQIREFGTGTVETRWRRKDGRIIDVLVSSTPLDPEDLSRGVTFTALDITERKRSEAIVRESEAMLSSLIRCAPVGIGHINDRIFTRVNDRLCEMVGYSADEMVNHGSRMLYLSDEDYDFVAAEISRGIEANGTGTVEIRWKRRDGAIIDVLLGTTPLDQDDWSKGATFSALDITERKQAEQALLDKNVALREILSQISADKEEVRRQIATNIEEAVLPTLMRLKESVTAGQIRLVESLEKELQDISSPFLDLLRHRHLKLTPRESEVCRLIKNGLTSKEIAESLSLSLTTVHKHREMIRKKLGLANVDINLASYLQSLRVRS